MVKVTETREDKLNSLISKIDTNFGKGSIMRLGDNVGMKIETVPSGALTLDIALGGGLPKGRLVELYGSESAGKSSLTLHVVAEVQKAGGTAAYIDVEHAIDPKYAEAIGVNVSDLLICQPESSEMALEVCDQLVKSGTIDLVVIDSVAALVPRAELEGEMGDASMGVMARMMGQACRKLTHSVKESKCLVIFINQTRQNIGGYGNPTVTPGGKALKFFASVRMEISRIQTLKKGSEEYGIRSKVKVVKNKVALPFKVAEFDILFGQGISTLGCIVDLAEELKIVTRRGAWYSYGEEGNVAQGRDKLIQWLIDNPDKCAEIEGMVKTMSEITKEDN